MTAERVVVQQAARAATILTLEMLKVQPADAAQIQNCLTNCRWTWA
jgi:hypothetical protein